MKGVPLLVAVLLALFGCSKPATSPNATSVYLQLVDAGCMAEDDAGPASVAEEEALDASYPWMRCLFAGGTVASCNVPCSADSHK